MAENEEIKNKKMAGNWKRWLNYQSLVTQLPFILFLALLAVLYIYNGHYADKTNRQINQISREVQELQYEYVNLKSKVLGRSIRSQLVKAVEPLGLRELNEVPVVLYDTTVVQ